MICFSINVAAADYWYDIVKRECIYFGSNAIEFEGYFFYCLIMEWVINNYLSGKL